MAQLLEFLLLNAATCTVLASLVWLAGLLPAIRRRPALRYGLWMIVLVKLVTPPLVELRLVPHWRTAAHVETLPSAPAVPIDVAVESTVSLSLPVEAALLLPPEVTATPTPSINWTLWLLTSSFAGTLVVLAISLRQIGRLRRVLRHSESDDPRVMRIVQQAAEAMGMTRSPRVSLVNAAVSPLLWVGRSGPLIVLPRGLVDELTDEQLACVISHEMAHYIRRDHWGNTASFLVAAVFWWHPVVWWVRRELRTTQEACCDALVISRSVVSRQSYAKTLFHALEFLQSRSAPVPALASGFGGKSSTQRRFEMIANPRVNHRLSWWNYVILSAAVAALPFWPALSSAEDVAIDDCPPSVQSTLQALQGAGHVLRIQRDADGEELFYEAEVSINGKVYDVRVSGQGTLLSTVYSRTADATADAVSSRTLELPAGSVQFIHRPWQQIEVDEVRGPHAEVERVVIVEDHEHETGESQNPGARIRIMQFHEQPAEEGAAEEEQVLRGPGDAIDVRIVRVQERIAQQQSATDQAATDVEIEHERQLRMEIARLMEQISELLAVPNSRTPAVVLQEMQRTLETQQRELVMREMERARAAHEAATLDLVARQQFQLAEQAVQHAESQQRLAQGLPDSIRNTLARESVGGSIQRITVTADEEGTVTYTAQVRFRTDDGPRQYEILINEQGELLHKHSFL